MKDDRKLSQFISYILRHKPEDIGIRLDEHGWADVDDLIKGAQDILKDATISSHEALEQEMIRDYLHSRRPLLPNIDELFGTYTAEDQRRDAYRLKNKEIGFRIDQQGNIID